MTKRFYEPAQCYVGYSNGYYFDNNGKMLPDPRDYDFSNGFISL